MKYVALIPSYEPDDRLIKIINELMSSKFEVILVNDGSNREYDKIFKKCKPSKYLSYDKNMGKGYALKTGLKYIQENYKDVVVVTMDSDGQHTVKDATNLCNIVSKKDNTVLLGRRLRGEKTPLKSKIGNALTRFIYRVSSGIDIYDTQTGLRAFKSNLIPFMLEVEGNRFEYEMNVLLESPRNNISLIEEDIEVIYEDNNSGTHFHPIKDSWRIYKHIFKRLFKYIVSSLLSFLVDYGLYSLILVLSNNLILSNISARVVSSTFNYTLNKKMVFKDKEKVLKSIIKYYILAAIVLGLNTVLLTLSVNVLGINKFVAKIIIEVILFILSYSVQKKFIFTKKKLNITLSKIYGIIFTLLLTGFTTYILLDTFVLTSNEKEAVTHHEEHVLKKNEKVISTKNYYKDANIEITVSSFKKYGTKIHYADIKISDIKYLKTALAKDRYGKNVAEKTSKMAKRNNAILAINGDFYGVQEKGYVVRDSNIYRDKAKKNQESLVITNDGEVSIINQSETSLDSLDNLKEVLSFGPGILDNGEIIVGKKEEIPTKHKKSNPRTAIGYIDKNHFIFVVSDGRTSKSDGLSLYELAKVMKSLGCNLAYNLDGGGSSTMYFNGKIINTPINSYQVKERKVSDIVYIGY